MYVEVLVCFLKCDYIGIDFVQDVDDFFRYSVAIGIDGFVYIVVGNVNGFYVEIMFYFVWGFYGKM